MTRSPGRPAQDRGNITANALKAQAYQFDLAHRMNAVTGQESYLYDGHGRRARSMNLQTGTIEYYGYGKDGRLLQDWSSRRQVRNGYVYLGNTVVGLYEVNLTNGTVTPKYQHTDALGSPVVTTNASKTVLSRMSYTPYGQPTLPMDGVGYTGHFMDVGTQLTYMQQRYYDSELARFMTVDPAESEFSEYNYASDNPLRFTDPDGRQIQDPYEVRLGNHLDGSEPYNRSCEATPSCFSKAAVDPNKVPGLNQIEWTQKKGSKWNYFEGPRRPRGPRWQLIWVPRGGASRSVGYWKLLIPGRPERRISADGRRALTPAQAHPGYGRAPGSPRIPPYLARAVSPAAATLLGLTYSEPLNEGEAVSIEALRAEASLLREQGD